VHPEPGVLPKDLAALHMATSDVDPDLDPDVDLDLDPDVDPYLDPDLDPVDA
jgi:hypothetical protein